ncbi:MAG: hydrolase [Chloroflexi bacterium]|nr:hydrolase [Chloroflexota bacterium]
MLERDKTLLVIVDVQGNLALSMVNREALYDNLSRAIRGCQILGVSVIWMEQNPRGLGPTVPEIASLLKGQAPIAKLSFSCCGSPAFLDRLRASGRTQVLLAGIEAHVCIYQTAADLVALGYHVEVVSDAVSSRTEQNRRIGLERCRAIGAGLTSVEMALLELLRTAEDPHFREILRVIR